MASADVIVANRAYVDHTRPPGEPLPTAGAGGLLVAVSPTIARDGSTTWVGAGRGQYDRDFTDDAGREDFPLPGGGSLAIRRVYLDEATWDGHYNEVANGFLWPMLHLVRGSLPNLTSYFPSPATPSTSDWEAFVRANRAFAEAAANCGRDESCWVHDYQLGLVPGFVRESGYAGAIGFFLHTPFPSLAVVRELVDDAGLAHVTAWVRGILGADLVGFQSAADVDRFAEAARELAGCDAGTEDGGGVTLRFEGRRVRVEAFPVGIDFEQTVADAHSARLPALLGSRPRGPLVAGLERADYTKGVPERLAAIRDLYREGAKFSYVGIASPTREGVAAYDRYRAECDALAAECAAAAPEGYTFVSEAAPLEWAEVLGLMDAANVICTSSLSDGMNLVPLQAIAVHSLKPGGERGMTTAGRDAGVASAFAGFEREGLVTFDPLDHAAVVGALREAIEGHAGRISDRLVSAVRGHDAKDWGRGFLAALEDAHAHA